MIETDKIIEIIKTARSLGANRVEIDADGSISIEWSEPVYLQPYTPTPIDPDGSKNPLPGPTMAYMAQFTTTTCEGDKK